MKRVIIRIVVGGGLSLVAAGTAIAERPARRDACLKTCVAQLRDCLPAARADLKSCKEPCADSRDAAAAACDRESRDELSQECLDALEVFGDCTTPCRKSYRQDQRMCIRDAVDCLRGGCFSPDEAPTPTPTPFILN